MRPSPGPYRRAAPASRATVVFVPGLTRSIVDAGALPTVSAWLQKGGYAGVVPSFPCVVPAIQASVLCARLPAEHRVLGAAWRPRGERPRPVTATLLDRLDAELPGSHSVCIGLSIHPRAAARAESATPDPGIPAASDAACAAALVRTWSNGARGLAVGALSGLAEALVAHGPGNPSSYAAARAIDAALAEVAASRPPDGVLLVVGAPAYGASRAVVELPELAARCGAHGWGCDGAIARLTVPAAIRVRARDHLLDTRGVERVLDGDSSASWGFGELGSDELVALAEPGWAFIEHGAAVPAACAGHPDASDEDEPLALWAAAGRTPAWPTRVHDYRLGATLARALGLALDGLKDRPLAP